MPSPSKNSQEKLNRWLKKAQTCKNSEPGPVKFTGESDRVEESSVPNNGPIFITTKKDRDEDKESAEQGLQVKNDAKIGPSISTPKDIEGHSL